MGRHLIHPFFEAPLGILNSSLPVGYNVSNTLTLAPSGTDFVFLGPPVFLFHEALEGMGTIMMAVLSYACGAAL